MREKVPCRAPTADIGQYDEPEIDSVPAAPTVGPRSPLVDCKPLVEEGWPRWPARVPHSATARTYFNTTPLGRAVTAPSGARDARGRRPDLATAPPSRQRHRAFYRYGLLANPRCGSTSVADADFVTELGGRKEMSEWLVANDLPYRDSTEKRTPRRQHLGRHPRAKSLSTWTPASRSSTRSWACGSGPGGGDRARGRDIGFERAAGDDQRQGVRQPRRPVLEANAIGAGTPGHVRQIENRIIEQKPCIYEAPGWPCCTRVRAAGQRHPQRDTLPATTTGRGWPADVRGPCWTAGADAARVAAAVGRMAVTGEVTLRLARRGLLNSRHHRPVFSYHRTAVHGAHRGRGVRPVDRSASSPCATGHRRLRAKLEQYAGMACRQRPPGAAARPRSCVTASRGRMLGRPRHRHDQAVAAACPRRAAAPWALPTMPMPGVLLQLAASRDVQVAHGELAIRPPGRTRRPRCASMDSLSGCS